MKTLKSWSISKLFVFEECKYRAKLQWLDKIADAQPHAAADRGTQIHQEAEDYIRGKISLTHNLRYFADDFASLRSHFEAGLVTCEDEWAFTSNWESCEWSKGWLRLKADATCRLSFDHLTVIDFKTGKSFGNEVKHSRQLQLYALCALILYPDVDKVTCELWYLDQNELASFTMRRRQLTKYLRIFDQAGHGFTNETEFPPSPNIFSCKYCPYRPGKQGDCEHGVDTDQVNQPARPRQPAVEMPPLTDELAEFKGRI